MFLPDEIDVIYVRDREGSGGALVAMCVRLILISRLRLIPVLCEKFGDFRNKNKNKKKTSI